MSEKTGTRRVYRLFTYDDVWENTKKKCNLSDEELRGEVESELQMWAWSDIITEGTILRRLERGDKT